MVFQKKGTYEWLGDTYSNLESELQERKARCQEGNAINLDNY